MKLVKQADAYYAVLTPDWVYIVSPNSDSSTLITSLARLGYLVDAGAWQTSLNTLEALVPDDQFRKVMDVQLQLKSG